MQWQIDGGLTALASVSTTALAAGTGGDESDWIDRAVGTDAQVTVVWTGKTSLYTIWENEFFNRSVGLVYNLATPPFGSMRRRRWRPSIALDSCATRKSCRSMRHMYSRIRCSSGASKLQLIRRRT